MFRAQVHIASVDKCGPSGMLLLYGELMLKTSVNILGYRRNCKDLY